MAILEKRLSSIAGIVAIIAGAAATAVLYLNPEVFALTFVPEWLARALVILGAFLILAKKYSNYEKGAMLSLAMTLVWAWTYYGYRHSMSGRYGHLSYVFLGISGIVMLILMIKRSISKSNISWLRSFRWVYVASFGLAALAMANMTFTPHCPSHMFGNCPPADDAWYERALDTGNPVGAPDNLKYMEQYRKELSEKIKQDIPCIPPPYNEVYKSNKLPNATKCKEPWYRKAIELNHVREDIFWPPPELECSKPLICPPETIIGSRIWMSLVGMVGFLIPLVGMTGSTQPNGRRKYSIYAGFVVLLIIIFLWGHFAHPFYRGIPWYYLSTPADWTGFFFYGISVVHLICCYKAYKEFETDTAPLEKH